VTRATHDPRMTWRSKLKLRAWVFVVGAPLAAAGIISISPAWLTIPMVGVAVAVVTTAVSKVGARLAQPRCWTCGTDLAGETPGEHGVFCPSCGSLNQFYMAGLGRPADADEPTGPRAA
jgi:phage FluMu protein Com